MFDVAVVIMPSLPMPTRSRPFCQIITIGNSSNLFVGLVPFFGIHFDECRAERAIFATCEAVIACWSVWKRMCRIQLPKVTDWSTHYQKVILRTKTLISHLAASVVIGTAAITMTHIQSEIIHFAWRERQAKNDSFEFRITLRLRCVFFFG